MRECLYLCWCEPYTAFQWEIAMKRIVLLVFVVGVVAAACTPSVLTLSIGTCFDDPDSFEEVEDIPIIDCDSPHDNEVFANVDMTGSDYPGFEAVNNRAFQICEDNFAAYLGISYDESIYDIAWFNPTADTWDIGDREVICFAYDLTYEKITGTVNGIAK